MFNPLTRTLKLGLTAITILTSGGFAFAPMAEAQATEAQIAKCQANPFGTDATIHGSGGCATTLSLNAEQFSAAKERYCDTGDNRTLPICRPTTERWRFENPNAPSSVRTAIGGNQFVKGTADGIDFTGARYFYGASSRVGGALNLETAMFKNNPLGGNATDGVAYLNTSNIRGLRVVRFNAGLLSGTDLGAPVTGISGTKASWVGLFQSTNYSTTKDFVLEVTFGGSNTGSIEAFIKRRAYDYYYSTVSYYHLKGEFDNSGLITGTVDLGNFMDNDRDRPTGTDRYAGVLTGLIGEEGAVGAFIGTGVFADGKGGNDYTGRGGRSFYAGGFVARPAGDVDGAQAFLDGICNRNPFEKRNRALCNVEYANARVAIIDDCLQSDGTVKDSSDCTIAAEHNYCIINPFASGCDEDPDFKGFYVKARANRIEFCHNNADAKLAITLCGSFQAGEAVCERDLFGTGCLFHTRYDVARIRHAEFCARNPFGEACLSHSRYDAPRLKRADFCSSNMSDDLCEGQGVTLANICSQLPFHSDCVGYDDERLARAKLCANDDNETNPFCHKDYVTTADICTRVPFASTCDGDARFNPYREAHIASCNNGGSEAEGLDCTSTKVVEAICDDNLFGTVCLTDRDHDAERDALITTCNEEAHKNTAPCKTADVITAICDDNLFGTGCLTNRDHDVERAALIRTCNKEGNGNPAPCRPTDVVAAICEDNLFGTGCLLNSPDSESSYAVERKERLDFCGIATNSGDSGDSLCMNTNLDNICSYAPFSPPCLNHTISSHKRTDSKFTACRATGPTVPTCHGVRKEPSNLTPNVAAWVNDFVKKDNPNGLSLVADPNKGSQFLEGGNLRLDQAGITVKELGELYFSDIPHLNLASSATARPNGVAFFRAESSSISEILASGILSGTDLGAPASGASGTTAVWQGVFQSVFIATRTEFELEVTFDGSTGSSNTGSIKAFIERKSTDNRYSATPHYYLDGTFDANGLIKGRVIAAEFGEDNGERSPDNTIGTSYKGVLRGLIGEEGAVGAFVGGEIADDAYNTDNGNTFTGVSQFAGGFVAHSVTVGYDAWVNAAVPLDIASDQTTSSTTNRFLTTSGNVLNKGTVSGSSIPVTMDSAQYDGEALAGDVTDGFAYLRGSVNHVGILATTSLGAPLNSKTASGTWEGSFVSAEGNAGVKTKGFILNVNFVHASVIAEIHTTSSAFYKLTGTFNTRGVIDGTIRHTEAKVSNGIMTGLIGSEGAVGVFISNADADVSYGGGFVARPTR